MPQIIVQTGQPGSTHGDDVLRETAHAFDTESARSRDLLLERIGWALQDAEAIERARNTSYEEPAEPEFSRRSGSIADAALI